MILCHQEIQNIKNYQTYIFKIYQLNVRIHTRKYNLKIQTYNILAKFAMEIPISILERFSEKKEQISEI